MNQFELGILDSIVKATRNPLFDQIMPAISWLGSSGKIWIAVAVVFLILGTYRKAGITLAVALLTELGTVNGILKPWVDRVRPFELNTQAPIISALPTDSSFPSGHTASSFAAAYVIYHFNKTLGIVAYILAALIGFSRLYLYLHYPSDVLAGALIGALIGAFAIWLVNIIQKRWFPDCLIDTSKQLSGQANIR